MGCFCSCFRAPEEDESDEGTDVAAPQVGTNTPQDTLLENSSSPEDLELQGNVAVVGNGTGLGRLQFEYGPTGERIVRVKRLYSATSEVGTNTPQGTLLPNSLRSRNLDLQGYGAVQGNGAGLVPLQLEHGPAEGEDVQVNVCSKSKDIAGGFSKDDKAETRCFASHVNVSSEKMETKHKEDFCLTRDEVECPTCLEEYTDENPKITSKCNHHFHLGCIYEWMERSSTCPICFEEMKFAENI